MKANELMIGDQVYLVKDYFKDSFKIKRKEILKIDALDLHRISDGLLEVEPIPLTVEILEKNGFKGEGYLILELDEFSYLEYYPFEGRLRKIWHGIDEWNNHSDTKDITFKCHCKYVHKLQHALRLCGLNEIADNLKI